MSKKRRTIYTARERKAEKEIDAFLQSIHGSQAINIIDELQEANRT